MKIHYTIRIERESMQMMDSLRIKALQEKVPQPNFSKIMREMLIDALIKEALKYDDKTLVKQLRAEQRSIERRIEMADILRNAGLEDYNKKKLERLVEMRGDVHPDVLEFKKLQKAEMNFRGERKAAQKVLKKAKLDVKVTKNGKK